MIVQIPKTMYNGLEGGLYFVSYEDCRQIIFRIKGFGGSND